MDLFDAVPRHLRRCKACGSYDGPTTGRNAAGDCKSNVSPREITTPEATCDDWKARK